MQSRLGVKSSWQVGCITLTYLPSSGYQSVAFGRCFCDIHQAILLELFIAWSGLVSCEPCTLASIQTKAAGLVRAETLNSNQSLSLSRQLQNIPFYICSLIGLSPSLSILPSVPFCNHNRLMVEQEQGCRLIWSVVFARRWPKI